MTDTTLSRLDGPTDPVAVARLFADWFAALTPATRRNYAADLDAFAAFIGAADRREAARRLCCASTVEARSLALRFKTALREKGEAPGTINRRLSSLRSLYKHVVGASLAIKGVRAIRRRRIHLGSVSPVTALLAAARTGTGIKALRDTALITAVHDSGLRRAEAASLRLQDLDLDARIAYVRGKGGQGERQPVNLSEPAALALRAYLGARGNPTEGPVFASCDRARKGDGAITGEGVRLVLAALSEEASLKERIRPHDLRRAGAKALARAGADAEALRTWGRWADYRTPAVYVGEVAEKAREAVDLLASLRKVAS